MSITPGIVFGMGNPLLDISTHCKQELLDKYVLKAGNAILAEPSHVPLYEELVRDYKVDYIAGGATQNSIRACQYMLQTPKSTTYVGCVGDDKYATQLTEAAHKDGVDVHYMVTKEAPTGTCACLIVQRERSLVANLGAANHYKIEHLMQPEQQELIARAQYYYISGFFLTVSPDSALFVGKHAAEHNKVFSLNLAAPFVMEFFGQHVDALFPYADFVFGNEHEWAVFGKTHKYEETELGQIALRASATTKVNTKRERICVVTQGAEAVLLCSAGKIETYAVNKVPSSEIVDTNGCGDSFVGGFLSGLARGWPLAKCVSAGNYIAAEVIRRDGCQFPEHAPTFTA